MVLCLMWLAGPVMAAQEDYKHWSDEAPASWQNGALQASNSEYFEGEVLPHYWKTEGLTVGATYAFAIYYDYYWATENGGGFDYLAQYDSSRTPTILDVAPSADNAFPEGHGNFYTAGADITSVSAPVNAGDGKQRYILVTFTATSAKAEFYYGLHMAEPGAIASGSTGAHDWPGASLQTYISPTPVVAGATMLGGGGTLALNPGGVLAASISGFKWKDINNNGIADISEPKLSGWTIRLCSDSGCSSILETQTTATDGSYSFSVVPGTYYVREVVQSDWTQTAPASGYYGPLVVTSLTPVYIDQNFGNNFCVPGNVCRAASGECDVAEVCTAEGECPVDAVQPDTHVCRADAGDCDLPENCDGTTKSCTADSFEPAGTACGDPSDTVCDNPDSCDASGACAVNHEAITVMCRGDAGECDVPEYCDATGACSG